MSSICEMSVSGVRTRSSPFLPHKEEQSFQAFNAPGIWKEKCPQGEEEARALAEELIGRCNSEKWQELDLSDLGLTFLPNLSDLIHLKSLLIAGNELKELPPEIESLIDLENLDLSDNQIKILPKFLGNLERLKTLTVSGNTIEKFPESIVKLKRLISLNMHDNELESIPSFLIELESLEVLNVSYNLLKEFPEVKIPKLKELNISGNEIPHFPEGIDKVSFKIFGRDDQIASFFDLLKRFLTELDETELVKDEWVSLTDKLQVLLNETEKKNYFDFAKIMTQSEDYRSSDESKQALLVSFLSILCKAAQDEVFKNRVSEIIREEGLGTCGDGVTLAMDTLHTELLLQELSKADTAQIVEGLLSIHRMRLIKGVMEERNYFVIGYNGKAIRFSEYSEQKETILALQQKLKGPLGLPILSSEMQFDAYAGITSRLVANVKRNVLERTRFVEDQATALLTFPQWKDRIEKDLEIRKIKDEWNKALMEDLFDSAKPKETGMSKEEVNKAQSATMDINAFFRNKLEQRQRDITEKFLERSKRQRIKPERFGYSIKV